MAKVKREVKLIELRKISPNKNQARKYFDESSIRELALSIKEVGLIQPLTLKESGFEEFEIISGERRYRALKMLGVSKAACIVVESEKEAYDLMSLIENIQRENLNFIEEARGYKALMDDYGLSQNEIADRVGKKQASISNLVRLLNLNDEAIGLIVENGLTQRHARALLSLPDSALRIKVINEIKSKDLNVKQTELLIEKLKSEVVLNNKSSNIKTRFNYKVYTNTIKRAYEDIIKTGHECSYDEKVFEDKVEVIITIKK